LTLQENVPDPIGVENLTRAGSVATATTITAHGYTTGDFVTVAGALPVGYNGKWKITVTGPESFTYSGAVIGTLATPATGSVTVTYVSDAQGGRKIGWEDLATVPAEMVPLSGLERIQAQALSSQVDYRFRIRVRPDATPQMRALWTPTWPPGAPTHTLEIRSVLPDQDGRFYQLIDAGEIV
jgi:head-tail adaptor